MDTDIFFSSKKNYLKHSVSEEDIIDKPVTLNANFNYEGSKTITHDLGYIPLVRAWYDPNDNGTIHPMNGQSGVRTDGFGLTDFWFYIDEITETTITFKTESVDQLSGTCPFWYKIYLDFEA